MSEGFEFIGPVREKKFLPDSRNALRFAVASFEGKVMKMTLEEYRPTRSDAQNRAWFGIVIKRFMDFMGERDKTFVHEAVLKEIGHYELVEVFGKMEKKVKRTRNMDTKAFAEMYEAAQELGARLGLIIPDPQSMEAAALMGVK